MRRSPQELKQELTAFCRGILGELAQTTANYSDLLALWQELHDAYLETTAASLQLWAETYDQSDIDKIEANDITVEVTDSKNGKVFRRNFPIKYVESANGVILTGETMEGRMSQIVLLSDFACTKVGDVTGRGADSPRDHDTP